MKRMNVCVWSLTMTVAMMFAACSETNESSLIDEGAKGKVELKLLFDKSNSAASRAAGSTMVPTTSWSNIADLQFFLYDANGVVKYAVSTVPGAGTEGENAARVFSYSDVPVGTYTLAVVANAANSNISPYIFNMETQWNAFNVRAKNIGDIYLKHKLYGDFPEFADPGGNNTGYMMPTEIFMGYAKDVVVSVGDENPNKCTLGLKREVSMMRLRLNLKDTEEDGVKNTSDASNGVDWTQNTSVLIYKLPEKMSVSEGNMGGTSNTSVKSDIQVYEGLFNDAESADSDKCLDEHFSLWKDIIVFPNNGGRANNKLSAEGADIDAPDGQKYFIVVSALGKVGHKLASGEPLVAETTIYWSGIIPKAFFPNIIREVNLTLKSGGSTELPEEPVEQGLLEISVGAPAQWDSNIQTVSLDL